MKKRQTARAIVGIALKLLGVGARKMLAFVKQLSPNIIGLVILDGILLIPAVIGVSCYLLDKPFIIRGVHGERWQNLIMPVFFVVMIIYEIYVYHTRGFDDWS